MLSIKFNTVATVINELKEKFKEKRLSYDLTQEGLSKKSGVSLGSLKRFETTGQISLESLLKLAVVLDCLDDFLLIANREDDEIKSIDEILNKKEKMFKKRGRIK